MRKHLGKLCAIGLAAMLAVFALAGCGGSGSSSAAASGSASAASDSATSASGSAAAATAQGGTLKFGCQNFSSGGIDPAVETNTAWNSSRYGILETLFKFNDDVQVISCLADADNYTVSDDHKKWTFNIISGNKFSSGADVTPSAVKASIDRLYEAGASGSTKPEQFLEKDAKITADDAAGTITIETQTAYPDLRANLADPAFGIVDVENTKDFTNGIIGTGPYMVDSFTPDVGYTLKANPNYREPVPFETVELKYMDDAQAKANALLAGDIDMANDVANKSALEELKANSDFTVNIANGTRTGFAWVNFNKILKNDALRQAVMMGIDGQTVDDVTLGGLYGYGYSVLPSNLPFNYDKLTYKFGYDKEAAMKLLDDAGIKDSDGDGIRELDGQPVKLVWVTYENRGLGDIAEAGKQLLTEIGIDVDLQVVDSQKDWDLMVSGDYDLISQNWNVYIAGSPDTFLGNWDKGNEVNYCGYGNDKYSEAYKALQTEMDADKRLELITTMQQCLLDDAAVLVHGYYTASMISNSKTVANAPVHPLDYYWLTTEVTPAA